MISLRAQVFACALTFSSAAAAAAPGPAALIAPNGSVTGSTVAFSWQAAPGATWYQFWLNAQNPTAVVTSHWYTAEQAGCPTGGGTCTVTLTLPLVPGAYAWFIQTWAPSGYGPWSSSRSFTYMDPRVWAATLPDTQRFTMVLNGAAALDNETGLTWQLAPSATATSWSGAINTCLQLRTAGRSGWRLPTFHELSSLALNGNPNSLPPGHPFTLGTSLRFWSQTLYADTGNILVGWFDGSSYFLTQQGKTDSYRAWCVRAPAGVER